MDYFAHYQSALKAILSSDFEEEDGIPEDVLRSTEAKSGLPIPESLRIYYRVAGNLDINREHNILYAPANLFLMDNMLVFMEENQCVVFWGFRQQDLKKTDPDVYQGTNSTPMEWYTENMSFSQFIVEMWQWQRGLLDKCS